MGIFDRIPDAMLDRMRTLEEIDSVDRHDGTPHAKRLRQITPETGRLLSFLVTVAPEGEIVELGTSAGYSTLWLILGGQEQDQHVITFEKDPAKAELARETFEAAGIGEWVALNLQDARLGLESMENIGFCFMDLDKEFYQTCYEQIVPRLVPGGLLVADNLLSHATELASFLDFVQNDKRVDALVLPVGKGELICRRIPCEDTLR